MKLPALHDALLNQMPEGASHDNEKCPICAMKELETASTSGGAMSEKTFTEAEVKSLVDSAVADATSALSQELASFKDSQTAAEIQAQIDAVKAEAEGRIAELQAALDTAVLEAENAKSDRDAIVAWLDEERATQELEALIEARTTERLEKVAQVATFPQDYVEANTARWVSLDDEAFESLLADYAAVAAKTEKSTERTAPPRETAFRQEREDATTGSGTAMKNVFALRSRGVDTRMV